MKIKISATQKALIEHYAYGIVAAGYATYQLNHKSIKEIVIGGLVGGLIVPLLAKVNPKSLVNSISTATGAPAPLVAEAVNAALTEANKVVAQETPKA
mgnify:FL=1